MPRQKGALRKSLLFPLCWPGEPCLLQEQQLPGVQSRGPWAPQQLGEQSEGRSQAKALVTALSICSAGWRGSKRLVWDLSSALSLSQSGASVFQLPSQSPGQRVEEFCGQSTGRRLSPVRDLLGLHELQQNLTPELYSVNMRQVNVGS